MEGGVGGWRLEALVLFCDSFSHSLHLLMNLITTFYSHVSFLYLQVISQNSCPKRCVLSSFSEDFRDELGMCNYIT